MNLKITDWVGMPHNTTLKFDEARYEQDASRKLEGFNGIDIQFLLPTKTT